MFENQPKGLWTLALANTGERFGYYTMLAVFALFLGENFGFDAGTASEIYTWFLTAVYFLPLFGGMAADKWGLQQDGNHRYPHHVPGLSCSWLSHWVEVL